MSDASRQRLKVSREGIVLIKSFEGFRPRAIRREEGGWVIGYGHTLSAREGASVSEADAELLLRYDLLPVEKSLNDTGPAGLNQHQFDALASFAFSVGLDRFAGSDVLRRLSEGARQEAADAFIGWPEPVLPENTLRRRVAERALFVADPSSPVTLSDLLSAPLPALSVEAATRPPSEPEAAPDLEVAAEPVPASQETKPDAVAETGASEPLDPRGVALATLLGEPHPAISEPVEPAPAADDWAEPVIPVFADIAPTQTPTAPAPAPDAATAEGETVPGPAVPLSDGEEPAPTTAEATPAETEGPIVEPVASGEPAPADPAVVIIEETPETSSDPAPADTTPPNPVTAQTPAERVDPIAMAAHRYAPYSAAMVGPLPYLSAATPRPQIPAAPPPAEAPAEPPPTDTPPAAVEPEPEPVAGPVVVEPAPTSELVLTPLEDPPEPTWSRPVWPSEQRADPEAPPAESGLFGEDLSLTPVGGPILRHELEVEAPARFDWSETGAFITMGAVGLTAFGASMAAFRLASEQSNGGAETTMIAWVLAVIGAACVGVSSFNLYRRWGLPGGD